MTTTATPARPPDALKTAGDASRQAFERAKNTMTGEDWRRFLKPKAHPERWVMVVLFVLTCWFPFAGFGALRGFRRAYSRIVSRQDVAPKLWPLDIPSLWGFAFGGVAGYIVGELIKRYAPEALELSRSTLSLLASAEARFVFAVVVSYWFWRWLNREQVEHDERGRYGSARYAMQRELTDYEVEKPFENLPAVRGKGFYVGYHGGQELVYPKQGHFLTVGGTRSGKGVSSIIPNLLLDSRGGSWVVIDPKGENAAVTAAHFKALGKDVILLNPWQLLAANYAAQGLNTSASFNPLSLLNTSSPLNLVDDVDILAEMIVPIPAGGVDKDHFTSRARSFVSGLILHLVTTPATPETPRTLETLWRWLRLSDVALEALIESMVGNDHPTAGPAVSTTGEAMAALKVGSSREFASIMSSAQRFTEFLKSPALAASMASSSFDLSKLSDGNTVVYVIIPTDRLKTASQWLRLVVTSLMRGVVRRPNKRVTFLLDEAYALGYVSEIETALGTYAGFNVSVWSIYQNLTQMRDLWGLNWENFLASAAVRQFFGIGDQFSAEYLSKFMGTETVVDFNALGQLKGVGARPLLNPDEVRRGSRNNMFTFIEQEYPAEVAKLSYLGITPLFRIAAPNPYHQTQPEQQQSTAQGST